MATDTERLTVLLEARIRDFERNMQRANKTANDNFRSIERRAAQTSSQLESTFERSGQKVGASIRMMTTTAMSALGAAVGTAQISKYADAWTSAANKITAAGVQMQVAQGTTVQIADIAQRSRSDFASVADLYARLTRAGQEFKATQGDIARVTETVAKALKLSGATSAETESALIQLGQGLSSGKLQGDELRSLLENAPVLAQSIAKEFGVAVGQLKDLGAAGELSADRVFKALKNAAPEINKAFSQTTATTAEAFKALEAAAIKFVGTSSVVKAATATVGAGVNALAKNFDTVATGAAALGAIIVARLIGQGLTPAAASMLATARAAAAAVPPMNALNASFMASAVAGNAGALAMRGISGALALVGGPAGATILGIGAAAIYFGARAREAEERARLYADALDRVRTASDAAASSQQNLGDQVAAAAAKQFEAQRNDLNRQLTATQNDVRQFAATIETEMRRAAAALRARGLSNEAGAEIDAMAAKFKSGEMSAQQLRDELFRLANSNPKFQHLADSLGPLLQRLAGAIALTAELRAKLGDVANQQRQMAASDLESRIPNPTAGTNPETESNRFRDDPVIRELTGQSIARRAVIEAEMDETKKKVRDKYNELRKEIFDAGGTIDPAQLRKQAEQIVAAENAGKGSKGGEKKNEFDRAEVNLQRRIREMEAEAAAIGKSGFEAAKTTEAFKLLEATKASNLPITDALKVKIDQLATAYANAKVKVDEAEKAQEAAKRSGDFLKESLSTAITDLIVEGKSLEDVFKNLAKAIAKAALQAALFGQGPFGGLMGGGIFGGVGKALGFATGGYVSGPGSRTSDSIPARLSDGEFVVNAKSTAQNRKLLEAINSGRPIARFAEGGPVGRIIAAPAMIGRAAGLNFAPSIEVNVEGGSRGPEADQALGANIAKQLEGIMRGVVISELRSQMRPGNLLG